MSDPQVDSGKRTWLIATSCAGVAGGVAAAVPFVASFQPSERARAAGGQADAVRGRDVHRIGRRVDGECLSPRGRREAAIEAAIGDAPCEAGPVSIRAL